MSIHDLKLRLSDIPGIETLTMTEIGGRKVFGFDGLIAAVDPQATDQEIDTAIRHAAELAKFGRSLADKKTASLPPVEYPIQPRKAETMTAPKPGSFAAMLKAKLNGAADRVVQAQNAGVARVDAAVAKMESAAAATTHVSEKVATVLEGQADDVFAELGQFSNDFGLDSEVG